MAIIAKYPMVNRRIPELTRLELVALVRCFLLRNWLHPKILFIFSDSNGVLFLHGYGVDEGGTGGILVESL